MDSKILYLIKSLGDDYRNGSALVDLMDYYNVTNLACITQEQAEQFYEMYKKTHKENLHERRDIFDI